MRLEPLAAEHLPELCARCHDEDLWRYTFQNSPFGDEVSAQRWLATTLADERCVPFAIVETSGGQIAGTTRFLDVDPAHRKLEIGWTVIAPRWHRTHVNTACKLLLLRYAFEQWKAVRVQFKAEAINARSRRALERLGATHEGTLRNFRTRPDGQIRDTSFYSIVASEWPAVRARLEQLFERYS
ncbi:MAG TPA: GNAT family protein, partial [Candidatus Baltobacteraceae bacterium]|nr:GNAT family protein [Candidatus Baltobacteraceae bacterium]